RLHRSGLLPLAVPGRLSLRPLRVVQPERRPRRRDRELRRGRQLPTPSLERDLPTDPAKLDGVHRGRADGQDRLRDGAGPAVVPGRAIQACHPGRRAASLHRTDRAEHPGLVVDVRAALQRRELDPQGSARRQPGHPLALGPVSRHVCGDTGEHVAGPAVLAITLLAGLVAIPRELYEAAESDGAGPVGRFWYVTVPLLQPVLAVVILFSTIFTLADFNIVYVLTRGGPMNMTHLFATYSFALGLQSGQIGQGAVVSL